MSSARKLHLVADYSLESEPESSGIRSNAALVTTAKIPKVQLDRLRQIRDERDAARMADVEANRGWADEAPTVQATAPQILAGIPSPLGDEDLIACENEPPPVPELTVIMRYSAAPQLPFVVAPSPSPVPYIPQFVSIVGAPAMSPAMIEAARISREAARKAEQTRTRTKWLVVAIWATAFVLAGSLGWIISHDQTTAAPVVTE
jgi:hypothetical protein